MSIEDPQAAFESHFATLRLDEDTLKLPSDKTIVPSQKQAFRARVDLLKTLPRIRTESMAGDTTPDLRMEGTLGEGGMGIIRLARQIPLERLVAVKSARSVDENSVTSLLHEAYVTGQLEHPNVVPLYTLGCDEGGAPLLVMKRIEGVSWREVLRDPSSVPGVPNIDLEWNLRVLINVCNAVRFAHSKGVIHRDIKPENVMIGEFGETYLLDWGIAVGSDPANTTIEHRDSATGIAGTPAYMAPEMTFNNASNVDERTDVYLLGATLCEIVRGTPPHQGASLFETLYSAVNSHAIAFAPRVDDELAAIANKALSKDKSDRFQTAEELREALLAYLNHRTSNALAAEARVSLAELRLLVGRNELEQTQLLRLHDLFGECRFGFHQAIKLWDDNQAARADLQLVLEIMTRHYLEIEYDVGATTTLNLMEDPPRELVSAVQELHEKKAAEASELASLKRLQDSVDLNMGRASRSLLLLFLGVTWAASTAYEGYRQLTNEIPEEQLLSEHFWAAPKLFGSAAIIMFVFRKKLMANRANSLLFIHMFILFVVLTATRGYALFFGMSTANATAIEFFMYALAAASGGLLSNKRVTVMGLLAFLPTAFLGMMNPEYQLFWLAGAVLFFSSAVAWIWRPQRA